MDNENKFQELAERSQGGDKRSYGQLLRAITQPLRGFILKRISGNADDADDVVQDILVSIHRAFHTYDASRPFEPWMFAIARYRLADYLRGIYKKAKETELDTDKISHVCNNLFEDREDLRKLLEKTLSSRARRIVVGMKVEGKTAAEMAIELNMNANAVKTAAHRAYKTLALAAKELDYD